MKIKTQEEKSIALDNNKEALVKARMSGDEDLQKSLSQEREKIKRNLFCLDCGVRINSRKYGPPSTHCRMHNPQLLSMKMKRWIALTIVLFTLPLMAVPSPQQGGAYVYFSFPSLPPDFSHYTVYYGTLSSNYTFTVIGSTTNLSVINLVRGTTYYFNVTQSTTNGIESDYTTEVSLTIPNKPPKAQALAAQPQ